MTIQVSLAAAASIPPPSDGQNIIERVLEQNRAAERRATQPIPLPEEDPRAALAGALQARKTAEETLAYAEAAYARAESLLDEMSGHLMTATRNATEAADATAAAIAQAIRDGGAVDVPSVTDERVHLAGIEAERKRAITKKAADELAGELATAKAALQAEALRVEKEISNVVVFEVVRLTNEFKAALQSALEAKQKIFGVAQKYPLPFAVQEALDHTLDSLTTYQPFNVRNGTKHFESWQRFIAELQLDAAAELNL